MSDFSKPYDETLLAFSVLKRLKSGGVNSFEERLRSQKIQYLAQLFGVSPCYGFGLYLRGPYSSSLAHDLFAIKSKNLKPNLANFIPEELEERFESLENFIDKKTTRELELVTTLHLLMTGMRLSEAEAIKKLQLLKEASPAEVRFAVCEIKKLF
jgi:uncharacterized protein YwgA